MNRHDFFLGFAERLRGRQQALACVLLVAVVFALYGTALYFDFVWDDVVYIQKNYRIQGLSLAHLRAIWGEAYLGHFAPLHHTLLALLYHFFRMEPWGYHLAQLFLHVAGVVLLFDIVKKLESSRVAFLATLLFVVHPANIETVAWVSETKSTLAFFFFLLSFGAFLRLRRQGHWWNGVLSALFLVFSLLAKINTVVAPAIFLLYDYKEHSLNKRNAWTLAVFFLISATFTAIHLSSFHGSEQVLEGSYYGGLGVHLMNLPLLVMFYLQMTIYPHPLSAWHMFPVQASLNGPVIIGWIAFLALLGFLLRTGRSIQFWGLWFLVFLAPVLQIIPFPIWVADRYLYIPAIGLFVLASRLFFQVGERLLSRWQRWVWEGTASAVVVAFAWLTSSHLPVWRDDLTLWETTTKTCLTSAYCHCNLGLALLQKGQTERGVKELISAVEIRPTPLYLVNLGDAYTLSLGDYRQALIAYQMAQERAAGNLTAEFYAKLARVYILTGELDKARNALHQGGQVNPREPRLWAVNAFLHWKEGDYEQARQSLGRVLAFTGQTSNLAGLLNQLWGQADQVGQLLSDLRRQ